MKITLQNGETIDSQDIRADELFILKKLKIKANNWLALKEKARLSSDIENSYPITFQKRLLILERVSILHYQILLSRAYALQNKKVLQNKAIPYLVKFGRKSIKKKHKDERTRMGLGKAFLECSRLLREIYFHMANVVELSFAIVETIDLTRKMPERSDRKEWGKTFKQVKKTMNGYLKAHDKAMTHVREIKYARDNLSHGWKPVEEYRILKNFEWMVPQVLYQRGVAVPWKTGNNYGKVEVVKKLESHWNSLDVWCEEIVFKFLVDRWSIFANKLGL